MPEEPKEQYVEGRLAGCQGSSCEATCCDDDQVEEWVNEYFQFHDKIKDYLKLIGISIEFAGDRVRFTGCSDGERCKFLVHSLNRTIDPRPIDCKIYPFAVDWNSINFDRKTVKLYFWDESCPLIATNSIPDEFRREVVNIIQRDFAVLFYGARFTVEFADAVCEK